MLWDRLDDFIVGSREVLGLWSIFKFVILYLIVLENECCFSKNFVDNMVVIMGLKRMVVEGGFIICGYICL